MMNTIDYASYKQMRLSLIESLEQGKIDKPQFIIANLALYENRKAVEPHRLTSLEQGIIYYQYYNTLAKYHQIEYRRLAQYDEYQALYHKSQSTSYYASKERITFMMLSEITDEPVVAYFVKSNSEQLKQKLVEIVLPNREKIILHSIDQDVIRLLKVKKWLEIGVRKSLIDQYINSPYYQI